MQVADLLVEHAAELLTFVGTGDQPRIGRALRDPGTIHDGALAAADGQIVAVGSTLQVRGQVELTSDARVVDASGSVVLPGFVDLHTHLAMAVAAAADSPRVDEETLVPLGLSQLDHILRSGTTTAESKSAGRSAEEVISFLRVLHRLSALHEIDLVPTVLAGYVIPPAPAHGVQGYVAQFIEEILPVVDDEDLAEFCDVHCDARGLPLPQARAVLEAAGEMGLTPKVHADMDADAGGARLAAEVDAISADHLSAASDAGLAAMVDAGTIAVLLPGTAGAAQLPSSRPRRMIEMGLTVALGTDYGAPGAPTWSMLDVVALACTRLEMLPAEALAAVTINAAWAIGMAEEIGSLEPGKAADIIALNVGDHHTLASASAVPQVRLVIKRGQPVSG